MVSFSTLGVHELRFHQTHEHLASCTHILPKAAGLIGHFRVPKTLTFKMRLGAQPFLWKWVLYAWKWKWFPDQRLSTYPRFETEACGNSQMAWKVDVTRLFVLLPDFYHLIFLGDSILCVVGSKERMWAWICLILNDNVLFCIVTLLQGCHS